MKKRILTILLGLILCTLFSGCQRNVEPISKSGFYFDTVITITLYNTTDEALLDDCFSMAERYENLFSKTIEASDVYRINHSDGQSVNVDPETFYLIEKALSFAGMTDGKIDPTILPLSDLWNFGKNDTVPQKQDIENALLSVDYTQVILDKENSSVTLTNTNAGIDLGFIAKGYIADKMKEYLLEKGVTNALINLGGNILTIGTKPDSSPFNLGIQEPFSSHTTPVTTVKVTDKSVVTSGVYERYFYENDVLYHHILDTKTGYPVDTDLLGVTILSDSSMEGDAYSTICMCLGLDDGLKLIEQTEGIEALFITKDMELIYSGGFPK